MTNSAKLNQAMGLHRSSTSKKQKVQPITKVVKNDENSVNLSLASITSNLHDISTPNRPISSDLAYNSWVVEHPSALGSFDRMMKAAKGKRMVVFLDYDGTLSPIVDDPDRAFMSDEMRAAVREVAKYFPTAVISGRSRDKVKGFVQLSNVYYAGSHGMDIMVPPRPLNPCDGKNHTTTMDKKASDVLFQPAKRFLPAIQEIRTLLEEITRKIEGARVEDNRFCISVHFRKVRDEVLEVRPSIEWNKGHALEYLLDTLGFSNSSDVLPLYIGDDRTDEDAFKVIRSRGLGFPIIVSSTPRDTKACYSLQDPSEVLTFLLRIARWRKASSSSRSLAQIWGPGNLPRSVN
ncbi:probable trehalose-phosphate phosphatase G isoform X3 [Pyrus x bretschneideri]|uniref:probable trehalose-phosphate phosphatase G isoform X3 n=1 Tax=Pyrus x bretschneideri TaxID=225117 RepID=UPI00202E09BF|nr:probable trehalose-phosphate phosphatase G isoform X3 [Pyrus x bretschneideri]